MEFLLLAVVVIVLLVGTIIYKKRKAKQHEIEFLTKEQIADDCDYNDYADYFVNMLSNVIKNSHNSNLALDDVDRLINVKEGFFSYRDEYESKRDAIYKLTLYYHNNYGINVNEFLKRNLK